jgi:hypothetical protein
MMTEICTKCQSKNVKKDGDPEFHWGTFAVNGVNPIHIQKLICRDCGKIFGKICLEGELIDDVLMEIN